MHEKTVASSQRLETMPTEEADKQHLSHFVNTAYYMVGIHKILERLEVGGETAELDRETVFFAGLLHDIGKKYVPDAVLNKPSSLTPEEWGIMKSHPRRGADWVEGYCERPIAQVWPNPQLESVYAAAAYHHERIDGKGYPFGFRGQDIPDIAKLCAVADLYDAITADRPYRKGQSSEKALQVMREVAGTQLDPTIVSAALEDTSWTDRRMSEEEEDYWSNFIRDIWKGDA